MADEINRASPRTQSALLQAMQEHKVTVAGQDHPLPEPFHVMATQNPLEQEGTYPLPEAQLDRFLLQIDIAYPDLAAERQMLLATTVTSESAVKAVITAEELQDIQALVRRMPISEKVVDGILALVRQGRPETSTLDIVKKYVVWGPGPRAARRSASPPAPARCWTAVSRLRSTMCSLSASRSCSTAWRSASLPARKMCAWTMCCRR